MALVNYGLIHREGDKDYKGVRHHTEVYEVRVDTQGEYQGTVAAYIPGDVFNSIHPDDGLARLKKKKASLVGAKDDGGIWWTVTLEWDTEPFDFGASDSSGGPPSGDPGQAQNAEIQPDLRVPQVSLDTVQVEKHLTVDYDGVAVKASNGQPFSPPLKVTTYRTQITITLFKALGADSYANSVAYRGKVNTTNFLGFAAGKLLCKDYKLQSQFEHNAYWWQKTLVLEVEEDGWNPVKILDAGTFEKCSDGNKPIRDREGQPVTDPVPLNGAGKAVIGSQCGGGGTETFLEFKGHRTISYAGIL